MWRKTALILLVAVALFCSGCAASMMSKKIILCEIQSI